MEFSRKEMGERLISWMGCCATLFSILPNSPNSLFLKIDIFQNRIFVFTPKGDVIDLPEDSTPIDFAYHIHTDIGNKCNGVKINEKMENLDTKLKSGDLVEIIIDKNRKRPNTDWLKFVKTHHAREKIRYQTKHNR